MKDERPEAWRERAETCPKSHSQVVREKKREARSLDPILVLLPLHSDCRTEIPPGGSHVKEIADAPRLRVAHFPCWTEGFTAGADLAVQLG